MSEYIPAQKIEPQYFMVKNERNGHEEISPYTEQILQKCRLMTKLNRSCQPGIQTPRRKIVLTQLFYPPSDLSKSKTPFSILLLNN